MKRQEKENTRALEGVTSAPPSDVVALRRVLRTKQYFHRSQLFVLFLTLSRVPLFPPGCTGEDRQRSTIGAARRGGPNDSRAGRTANRRNEPIIEGTVVIFPGHRTMIPARENAPRHRVPNLYRSGRLSPFHVALSLSLSLLLSARSASH